MTPAQLQAARVALRLSQRKLAALLGVSHMTVMRWEHGESRIPQATAMLIERLLEESTDVAPRATIAPIPARS